MSRLFFFFYPRASFIDGLISTYREILHVFRFTESKLHGSVSFRSSFVTLHDMKYAQVYFSSSLVTSKLPDFFLFFLLLLFPLRIFFDATLLSFHPIPEEFFFSYGHRNGFSRNESEKFRTRRLLIIGRISTLLRFFFLLNFQLRFILDSWRDVKSSFRKGI